MQKKKLLFCLFFGAIHYSYPMEDANVSAHTSKTIPKDEMFNLAFKWSRENNVEKLESFFASIEWCMHANKEHMFEILLQNAIGQDNNLKTVQCLFDHGAKINIQKRATNPKAFEFYYYYKQLDIDSYLHPRSNNIFHFWFTPQSVDLCKLLMKQTIIEQVGNAIKSKCINTFTLCMLRQRAHGATYFSKDIRNLLQRYLWKAGGDEFIKSSKLHPQDLAKIVGPSCEQICPFLKIVLETKCERNKRPYDHIASRRNLRGKLIPSEENLMTLLDPERIHITVSEMAHELYPKLEISITDPNPSLATRLNQALARLLKNNI